MGKSSLEVYTINDMSSMTGGSSSSRSFAPAHTAFDVRIEAEALTLLRQIHYAALDDDVKSSLRDALFAFRSGSDISEVPDTLVSLFAEHGYTLVTDTTSDLTETAVEQSEPAATVSESVMFQRRQPRFGTSVSPAAQKPTSPPKNQSATSSTEPSAAKPKHAEATPKTERDTEMADTPRSVPVRKLEEQKTTAKPETADDSHTEKGAAEKSTPRTADKKTTTAPKAANSTPQSEPDAITTPASDTSTIPPIATEQAPHTANTAEEAVERIQEIKHEVNALVGNPVSIIDTDEKIGREYMAALLDAMKAVGGGKSETSSARALSRLEQAYQAVLSLMAEETNTPATGPTTEEETTADDTEVTSTETKDTSTETVKNEPAPDTTEHSTPIPPAATEATQEGTVDQSPATDTEANTSASTETSAEKDDPIVSPATQKKISTQLAETQAQAMAQHEQRKNAEDPLYSQEVTDGLQQLLSEWSLFKRSGVFGTGPNGDEHPLYKKIANLTIAAVLAGRFEEATNEIKRSINDYMNGWRYEEGIVPEQGETFETYLRRVIYQILNKRKK